jgi:SpoVK/Ycf46/Vps4 family AAA+-type ATPase
MEDDQTSEAGKVGTTKNPPSAEEGSEPPKDTGNSKPDSSDDLDSEPSSKAASALSATTTPESGCTSTTTPEPERTATTILDPESMGAKLFDYTPFESMLLNLDSLDKTAPSGLKIPLWFLNRNVKTVTDLAESPKVVEITGGEQPAPDEGTGKRKKMVTNSAESSKVIEITDQRTEKRKKKKKSKKRSECKFKVSHEFYSQLRDAAQACFPNEYLHEEWLENNPSLLLQVPLHGGIDFLGAVVEELARDLSAHLISLNAEDISDLGYEFSLVENPTHSPSDPFARCSTYFGTACPRHSSHNAALIENTLGAILASPELKMRNVVIEGTSLKGESASTQNPLILHLKDVKEISELPRGTKTLRAFRTAVQKLRKQKRPVLLVASMHSKAVEKDVSDETIDKINRKILICKESIIEIAPPKLAKYKELLALDAGNHVREVNFRRLRRMLRCMLRPDLQERCLSSWTEQAIMHNSALSWVSDKTIWSGDFLQRAVRQIVGRIKSNSNLELADAGDVVTRLTKTTTMMEKWADGEEPSGDASTEGLPAARSTKLKAKLDKIKETCTEYEKVLLEGVIDPGKLPTPKHVLGLFLINNLEHIKVSFDDICVDQEIVDGLKRLITLSIIRPDISSYGALSHARITGAMLYGPPGTGKTHLARAVARSSGANMLVVSGSNILNQYVGETEKSIKAIFSLAMKLEPCVIFLDEADGFLRGRTSKDASWQRTQINQFLQEWDGLTSERQSPFVLVATNRPGDLDDAVMRRLPQKYYLGLPGQEARLGILKIVLKDESLGPQMSIEALAAATVGFSGSDLRSLCVLAALLCESEVHYDPLSANAGSKSPHRVIEARHFAKALERTKRTVSEEALSEVIDFARKYDQKYAMAAEVQTQSRSNRFSMRSLLSWKRKS